MYGTGSSLYVAGPAPAVALGAPRTEIYKFALAGDRPPRFVASGAVPGTLLNQYALSEYAGNLRVATTTDGPQGTVSAVRVLAQRGRQLLLVGAVDGLGTGERIYAVRFAGPTAYVVTFRQTDPLYVLDLGDPRHPKAAGELKISGYSAYLHPVGAHRLIGVGQEATPEGQRLGTQVSLFDVGDPARPRLLARHQVPDSYLSEVENDPHAFLYWPKRELVALPTGTGDLLLSIGAGSLTELGTIGIGSFPVRRTLVVGETVWALVDNALLAYDLQSLRELAQLPLG